jgi:Flp pilus assembly protein TadG
MRCAHFLKPEALRGVRALRGSAARFVRDDSGSLLVWNLVTLTGIFMAVGVGITTQWAELHRVSMQSTLDSAVLHATDLDQMRPPKEVVIDYFTRAGLAEALNGDPIVEQGMNTRTVGASASVESPTVFLPVKETWTVGVASEANETIENIEISMVLDISGSMRFDDRITPLREAAKNFVDLVLAGDKANETTITIVPYAGATNPGPILFNALGGTRDHTDSSCLFLEDDDFTHTGLPKYSTSQIPHFHKWDIAWDYMDWGWCPSDTMSIVPLSNDADALKSFIDGMRLHDGTGTMFGMKYGLAFLDPTSRPTFDLLEAADLITGPGVNRPSDWNDTSTEKFIVLMTDGKITDQFQPKHTEFRDPDEDDEDNESGDRDDVDGIDHAKLNAEEETDEQGSIGGAKKVKGRSQNLTNFYNVCNLAKQKGVIVYTIAFEAPAAAAEEMRRCASYSTHFYEVDQLQVGAAFSSIARQISKLRLTQ